MRLILFILLFSTACEGQVIRANPLYRPFAVGSSCSYLLDQYSGAAAAYSLRKLDCDYAGSAIRVRRDNDNAEQDIGFTANGDLDTVSLKTFVSTNSGYVTTWYDQSGNANNATQTTAGNQPLIIDAGVVERVNSKPAIRLTNSLNTYFVISTQNYTDFTWFTVTKKSSTSADQSIIFVGSALDWGGDDVNNGGLPYYYNLISGSNTSASGGETSQHLSYYNRAGTNAKGGSNGELKSYSTVSGTSTFINNLFTFSYALSYAYEGWGQELILYDSDKNADRSSIESNINSFYSIY